MSNELVALERQLEPLSPRFAQVLPPNIKVERLIRTIIVSVERQPALLKCERQSLFNAAMSAAVLGLEVDGVTGQAYLIPFANKVQLVVGYKGYNTMAARSGITITGGVVREGDLFEFELGSAAFVRHVPHLGSKGRLIAAWACATSKARPAVVCVLDIDELNAVKNKSPGAKRSDSPWNDQAIGFPAMCEKTAKRRLARSLPLNIIQLAARMDEAVDEQGQSAWIGPDQNVVIEGDVIPPRQDSRTPTAQELIEPDREFKTTDVIPTAEEYYEQWRVHMLNATSAQSLGERWASEKEMRRQIDWTAEHPLQGLVRKVERAIETLKAPA